MTIGFSGTMSDGGDSLRGWTESGEGGLGKWFAEAKNATNRKIEQILMF